MNEVELTIICLATTAYVSQSQRWKKIEKKKEAIDRDTRVALRNVAYQRPACGRQRVRPARCRTLPPSPRQQHLSPNTTKGLCMSLIETP